MFMKSPCEIAFRWMPQTNFDDESALVRISHQAFTWSNVDPDLCRHRFSLCYNVLITCLISNWSTSQIPQCTTPKSTVHHFVTEMCTHVHNSVTIMVYCGISVWCLMGFLWDCTIELPPWWRHQMETFSALLAICVGNSPVPGEFPAQRPETRSFDVFFDLRPNKRLSKQSWGYHAHYEVIVMTADTPSRITSPGIVNPGLMTCDGWKTFFVHESNILCVFMQGNKGQRHYTIIHRRPRVGNNCRLEHKLDSIFTDIFWCVLWNVKRFCLLGPFFTNMAEL